MKAETDVNPMILNHHEYIEQVLNKLHIDETEYLFNVHGRSNSVVSKASKREINDTIKKFSREAKYDDIIILNTECKRLISEFRRLRYMIKDNRQSWLDLNVHNDLNLELVKFYDTDSTEFKLRRIFNTYFRIPLYAFLSFITVVLTAFIIWSEITLFLNINLNPISFVIKSSDSVAASTILLTIYLSYFTICTFYPIFTLRTLTYDICRHNSDNLTVLTLTNFVSIICFPLCLNFIKILKLDDVTYFEEIMGPTEKIPFLGKNFMDYYPIILIIIAFFTLFNFYQKLCNYMGIVTFEGSPEERQLQIEDGIKLIKIELETCHFSNRNPDEAMNKYDVLKQSLITTKSKI